jgi:hypothetical protein
MAPRRQPSFFLHLVLGVACAAVVLLLLPEGTERWRRVVAVILAIGLGYQLATAFLYSASSKALRTKAWLEALAFPVLIAASQLIPETNGWILAAAGILWMTLVARIMR